MSARGPDLRHVHGHGDIFLIQFRNGKLFSREFEVQLVDVLVRDHKIVLLQHILARILYLDP